MGVWRDAKDEDTVLVHDDTERTQLDRSGSGFQDATQRTVVQTGGPTGLAFAGWGKRFPAKVIDLVCMGAISLLVEGLSRRLFPDSQGDGAGINQVYIVTLLIDMVLGLFYIGWFTGKFGATPGKMVMKLKVVNARGGKVGYPRALGRYAAEFILVLGLTVVAGIGAFVLSQNQFLGLVVLLAAIVLCYISIFFDPQRRGVPDYISHTRVVMV